MAWVSQHKNWVRLVVFVLLLIAILGPWATKATASRHRSFATLLFFLRERQLRWADVGRLHSFFLCSCYPIIDLSILIRRAVLSERGREFLILLPALLLVLLPVTSTLLRVRSPNNRSFHIFSVISWGLAVGLGLLIAAIAEVFHPAHLWGLWLYIGLAGTVLAWEL